MTGIVRAESRDRARSTQIGIACELRRKPGAAVPELTMDGGPRIRAGLGDRADAARRLLQKALQIRRVQQPGQDRFFYSPGVTEPDATGPSAAAIGPHDAPRLAGQVVRRVLLRRNIVIDAETARLVAAAVQAALQAGEPSRRPGRGPRVPGVGCEPLS